MWTEGAPAHDQVQVSAGRIRVIRAGVSGAPAVLFVHGWPESAESWSAVMALAAREYHALAVDLPGIGGSTGARTDGSKAELAQAVHDVIQQLGLREVTLVGHDIGGMIVYSYLRRFTDLHAAVIMDVAVPGVPPWEQVLCNPNIWHFALHATPRLPELLVQGNQRALLRPLLRPAHR